MLLLLFLAAGLLQSPQALDLARARQLLGEGRAAEAAALYRELIRARGPNADLLLNLSIAEYKAGHFSAAAASASAALEHNPGSLPARLFLGASFLETGRLQEAIQALEQVVRANPGERNGRLMLGQALLEAGQAQAAMEHLRWAAKALPQHPRAWYLLARCAAVLGLKQEGDEAAAHLRALPPSPELHMLRGEAHERDGRWIEAAQEWKSALELGPDSRSARMGLASALFRSRDYEAALNALQPLMGARHSGAAFLYGASLLNMQQPDKAVPYLREALGGEPPVPAARAALGQALLQSGNPQDAIPLLEDALAADQDGTVHFQLFRAYQLTGQKEKSERALAGYRRLRAATTGR